MNVRKGTRWLAASLVAGCMGINAPYCVATGLPEATTVQFDTVHSRPIKLEGQLRRPADAGPFPAVVLLHGCAGDSHAMDARWGRLFQSWGYVALAVDSFGPRRLTNICGDAGKRGAMLFDGYAALQFLAEQTYVDPAKIVLMGTSMGGHITLVTIEQGWVERSAQRKFRAAVALYPVCAGSSGITTVPTLILIGENDDWTPAEACRNMAMGRSEIGYSRTENGNRSKLRLVVYPGVYHSFDNPKWTPGRSHLGHWVEYNAAATKAAGEEIRVFLDGTMRVPMTDGTGDDICFGIGKWSRRFSPQADILVASRPIASMSFPMSAYA